MTSFPYRYRQGGLIVPFQTPDQAKTWAEGQSRNLPGLHYVQTVGWSGWWITVGWFKDGAWTASNTTQVRP